MTLPVALPTALPAAEVVIVAVAFVWGAMLGSFVNVVLYRLPRRKSVVTGGSRCPGCGSPIRPYDNVPVLGWLLLRGRCRDCGSSVSRRYPLVEAACGVIAAAVAIAEITGMSVANDAASRPGIDRLLAGEWQGVARWAIRGGVAIAMLTWGLFAHDAAVCTAVCDNECVDDAGQPRPRSGDMIAAAGWRAHCPGAAWLAALVLVLAMVVPSIGPPGPLPNGLSPAGIAAWKVSLLATVAGLATGRVAGLLSRGAGDTCSLAVFGAAAGWQAVVVVTVVTVTCRLLFSGLAGDRWRSSGAECLILPAVAVAWLAAAGPFLAAWTLGWTAMTGG